MRLGEGRICPLLVATSLLTARAHSRGRGGPGQRGGRGAARRLRRPARQLPAVPAVPACCTVRSPSRIHRSHRLHSRSRYLKVCRGVGDGSRVQLAERFGRLAVRSVWEAGRGGWLVGRATCRVQHAAGGPSQNFAAPVRRVCTMHTAGHTRCDPSFFIKSSNALIKNHARPPCPHLGRDGLGHGKQRQRQVGKGVAVRLHRLALHNWRRLKLFNKLLKSCGLHSKVGKGVAVRLNRLALRIGERPRYLGMDFKVGGLKP